MKTQFILWVKKKALRFAGKFFLWAAFFSWGYVVLSLIPWGRTDNLSAIGFLYMIYLFILNFIAPIPTFFPSPNILLAIGFMIASGNLYVLYQQVGEDFPLRIWIKRSCAVVAGCALCLLPTFFDEPFYFLDAIPTRLFGDALLFCPTGSADGYFCAFYLGEKIILHLSLMRYGFCLSADTVDRYSRCCPSCFGNCV